MLFLSKKEFEEFYYFRYTWSIVRFQLGFKISNRSALKGHRHDW